MSRFVVILVAIGVAGLAACGTISLRAPIKNALVIPTGAPTVTPQVQTIRDILKNPPAPGQSFQVDAYYSGAWDFHLWGHCPPLTAPAKSLFRRFS